MVTRLRVGFTADVGHFSLLRNFQIGLEVAQPSIQRVLGGQAGKARR